jgi:TRAP-type C4-dicarboxylate transport system permease small subunit
MAEVEGRDQPQVPPRWVGSIAALSSRLNTLAAMIAGILLVLMTSLIIVEICLRFFSQSTYMTDVLVGYGVAAITFLAMAWALEKGTMIRVTVITQRLPLPARPWVEGFSLACALGAVGFLLHFQWYIMSRNFIRGTTTQHMLPIPLWIPDAIFFVGLSLLLLQFLVRLLFLLTTRYESEATLVL